MRPAVVVAPDNEIRAGLPLTLVAITGTITDPLPETQVELPWDPTGKARSGLKKRSVAVCNWRVEIEASEIERIIGHVSPTVVLEIIRRIPRIQ